MSLLASAFASASAPFVARSKHIVDAWQHLRKGIWMPCCAIVLALMVFILAPQIVSILLGDSYEGSSAVLRVLALLTIPSIVSQPLFIALQSSGRDRYVAWVSIGATIAQLGLVALLGQVLGAIGAAVASLVAQCGILVAFSAGIWVQVRQIREAEDRSSADPA
jgi:O-antigen/teichoic acid export membrane protein